MRPPSQTLVGTGGPRWHLRIRECATVLASTFPVTRLTIQVELDHRSQRDDIGDYWLGFSALCCGRELTGNNL
jgi:hypothetical protein